MRNLRVLICGAGVTGPALAHWLSRHGAVTTVVEIAPALRTTGFAVDFRGATHLGLLERMGVLDQLRARQTHGGAMRFVDEHDRLIFELPAGFAGGDLEVPRRDLSRILAGSATGVEYRFGDSVAAVAETPREIRVRFTGGDEQAFDILVGADGLHSGVRRVVLGPEERFVRHLGYTLAGWDTPCPDGVGCTPLHHNLPGRMLSVAADEHDPARAGAFAVFRSAGTPGGVGWDDTGAQRQIVAEAFAGMRWRAPALLDGLRAAPELYFDTISRVRVPTWSAGRTVLVGDAAWGVTLGGMGVGTGIVGAYVLAGELLAAGGDHRTAFTAYERRMRPYAARWQRGANPGRFLAPATAPGLRSRDALLRNRLVRRTLVGGTRSLATDTDLPDYAAQGSANRRASSR